MYRRLNKENYIEIFGEPTPKVPKCLIKKGRRLKRIVTLSCNYCGCAFKVSERVASAGRKFCNKWCSSHRTEI